MVSACGVDVGADHLPAVVDAQEERCGGARDVNGPEVAVVPDETVDRARRHAVVRAGLGVGIDVEAHDLSPVVDLQRARELSARDLEIDEPPFPGTQEGGGRGSLVVVVEPDDVATVVDVDVLVGIASARGILELCEAALRSRTKWRMTRSRPW